MSSTTVKEVVKESLLGHEETTQLSTQTRTRFMKNAVLNAETGELAMGPVEFINAIAPEGEDFVSPFPYPPFSAFFPPCLLLLSLALLRLIPVLY